MRSIWRTDRDLIRDALALGAAIMLVGGSFGALAGTAGLPLPLIAGMSLLVFAGGAQFLLVGVVAAGGSPVAALIGGLVMNARHLPFGLALRDVLGRGPARLLGAHLMVDESVAFALAHRDPRRARIAFWVSGVALLVGWQLGTLVGAAAAGQVGDPAAFGVDAAFPAAMLALILPVLRERVTGRVAAGAAAVALAATPVLPPGLPVLAGLAALLLALPAPRTRRRR